MTPLDYLRLLSTVSFPTTIADQAQLQLVSKLAYLGLINAEVSDAKYVRRTYQEAGFARIFGLTTEGILMLQEEASESDLAKTREPPQAQSGLHA
jgi:hypothetical protein